MGTAKGDGYTVTPRDLELVVNAIGCTRLPFEARTPTPSPSLDYEKLARRLGYKNAGSAKAAWNALKKKLDKVAEGAPVEQDVLTVGCAFPSLTIEPEPMRRIAGTPPRAESSSKKKGKQPAVEPPSETSEEESGDESDELPARKPSKKRKQTRAVDDDGDVPMLQSPQGKTSKSGPSKSKFKSSSKHDKLDLGGSRRRRPAPPSTTPSDTNSDSDSAAAPEPPTPRKKLKRKLTHLSVSDRPKDKGQSSSGKTARELENEAFVAREKAFEAFGMRGAAGGKSGGGYDDEDEDDEEVEMPPPPYIKKE